MKINICCIFWILSSLWLMQGCDSAFNSGNSGNVQPDIANRPIQSKELIWNGKMQFNTAIKGMPSQSASMNSLLEWGNLFRCDEFRDSIIGIRLTGNSILGTLHLMDSIAVAQELETKNVYYCLKNQYYSLIGQSLGNGQYFFQCKKDILIFINKPSGQFWALRKAPWNREFHRNGLLAVFRLDSALMPFIAIKRHVVSIDEEPDKNFLESYHYDDTSSQHRFWILTTPTSKEIVLEFPQMEALLNDGTQCHLNYFPQFSTEDLASWNIVPLWLDMGYAYPISHRDSPECK